MNLVNWAPEGEANGNGIICANFLTHGRVNQGIDRKGRKNGDTSLLIKKKTTASYLADIKFGRLSKNPSFSS